MSGGGGLFSWIGFRRRTRARALFVRPCAAAGFRWSYDPRFEPYSDGVEWVGDGGSAFPEETWLIGERLWHGWPDPPQWAFFALGAASGALRPVLCAWDFDAWPKRWARDERRGCAKREANV